MPSSAAIRTMISTCLFATATQGLCIGKPFGDLTMVP
jgi:hypothetical protein